MRATIRSFPPSLLSLLATLVLATSGCGDLFGVGYEFPTELDDTPADEPDPDPDLPGSDDNPVEDPCDGFDRNADWDCDGRANAGDEYNHDPFGTRQLFHVSVVDWTDDPDNVFDVGSGHGGQNDWQDLDNEVELSSDEEWFIADLDPNADGDGDGCTTYRHTLRGPADGQWADLACEDVSTRDPACMFDAGCAFNDWTTAGWAYAVTACEWGTHVATEAERAQIVLSEDICAELQAAQ